MKFAFRVPLSEAQSAKMYAQKNGILDNKRKSRKEDDHLLIPILREDKAFTVVEVDLEVYANTPSLREELRSVMSEEELDQVKTAFDLVGDIAILEIDKDIREKEKLIGEALLKIHPAVNTVVRKDGSHEGELRIQHYVHLAGEEKTETTVVESGIKLTLDIDQMYYSVRSSQERLRVAALIQEDERVLVMFSGIGPFVCVLAKHAPVSEIIGVELNEAAHMYASKNVTQNNLKNAAVKQGDVREIVPELGTFDRIIMPLPHTAQDFLDTALQAAKATCMIHLYHFSSEQEVNEFSEQVPSRLEELGRSGRVKHIQRCGNLAPGIHRWSIDIEVEK